MTTFLLLVGLGLPLISSVVYIVSILRGESRPHRMTRVLLMVITALSVAALWASDDRAAFWLAFVSLAQAVVILGLSLGHRGIGGRDPFDFFCLGLCAVGLVLWLMSGESLFGLIMSIVADLIACLPSLRKTIRLPHTESFMFYLLDTIAGVTIALAGEHTLNALLYPVYIVVINAGFAAAIRWPRRAVTGKRGNERFSTDNL